MWVIYFNSKSIPVTVVDMNWQIWIVILRCKSSQLIITDAQLCFSMDLLYLPIAGIFNGKSYT